MVTATKNSTNSSLNNTYTSLASKSTSELYKVDNSKTTSKSETSKSEDFKEVLNSKTNSKDNDVKNTDNVDKDETSTEVKDATDTKLDELKEKLKELDKDSESTSKDDVNEILSELLNLLAKLGIKEEDLKSNGEINSDVLKNMIEEVNLNESSTGNLNSVMEQLIKLVKTDSVKDGLDTDSLKLMEKLLSNLSAKLTDDNAEGAKNLKSNMKNLMAEISNMLDNKQDQGGKVLTLEDMLNKNYSQDSKDDSLENDSNKKTTSESTKDVSKENKFLSSLLDNKDDSTNKINLFASRSQTIQNQNVDTVQGLTVNKANFAEDLIKDVKFMSNNGLKELTVKVNPGNLGEITIKIVQEDGLMKANLKANSKETTALLSQNLVEIKKQLGEQNIKIADVNIELYQEDTTFFSEQGFDGQLSQEQERSNNRNINAVSNEVTNEEELIDNVASNDSNIEFFA